MSDENKPTVDGTNIDKTSLYWSAKTAGFYDGQFYDQYVNHSNWPSDCVPISQEIHAKYASGIPAGMTRGAGPDGMPAWVPLPPPTGAEAARAFNFKVDARLDAVAKLWGYSKGIDNATTWATSANPQFAAEGQALAAWRDKVWNWVASIDPATADVREIPKPPMRPGTESTNPSTGA